MINEQDFKKFVSKKFVKADLNEFIKNIQVGEIIKSYKLHAKEAFFITKIQTGIKERFYIWLLHSSGMLLRSGNGALGYDSQCKAELEAQKAVKTRLLKYC